MSDERDRTGLPGGGKDATGAPTASEGASRATEGAPDGDHWLVRPGTIRLLWIVFIAILVLTVLPDFVIEQYEHFGIDDSFGFYAWYGFGTCVAMVVFAKLLGIFLKRKDTYYDD